MQDLISTIADAAARIERHQVGAAAVRQRQLGDDGRNSSARK